MGLETSVFLNREQEEDVFLDAMKTDKGEVTMFYIQ